MSTGHGAAAVEDAALRVRGVRSAYGLVEVLHGVDLLVPRGQITVVLGPNGAGKTTLCGTITGLVPTSKGAVVLDDAAVSGRPQRRVNDGIVLVPEGRGIFPGLSVDDNLRIRSRHASDRDRAYARFPSLGARRRVPAGSLSGGEQQMLSLAAVLADRPKLLIVDEPTLGLAPLVAEEVLHVLVELCRSGTTVVVAEEKRQTVEAVANHLVVLALGRVLWEGPPDRIPADVLDAAYGLHSDTEPASIATMT